MKRYFAYIRVSTPKQGQGVSLQEQQAAITAHASRQGYTIVEWFEEKETAAKEGRDVFSKMLARLERGDADGVLIHKIDRSARNLWDWANLGKLFDRGIDVQFAHDSIDLHSRGGRLSADIMAVVAADYVRNLRDEVKKGFYGRLKQGVYPLPAPLGYLDRGSGKAKDIDPMLGPLVREAFERYATGTVSLRTLAEEMHTRGLKPRRSDRLSINTLAGILHNPFYIGIIRIVRTDETFAGIHTPLIDKALFERVQAVLAGKAVLTTTKHDFVYRRFVKCGACGRHLVGEFKKGRYTYYRCYAPCNGASIREEVLDSLIARCLENTVLTPVEIGDLRDLVLEDMADTSAANARQQASLQMQLAQCDERLTRLTDALIDLLIDKETYEARKAALLLERQDLKDALARPILSPAQKVQQYLELENVQYSSFNSANPAERRRMARAVTWNLQVSGKSPAITLKSPYQEIVNWRISDVGGPYRSTHGTRTKKLYRVLKRVAEREIQGSRSVEDKSLKSPRPQLLIITKCSPQDDAGPGGLH